MLAAQRDSVSTDAIVIVVVLMDKTKLRPQTVLRISPCPSLTIRSPGAHMTTASLFSFSKLALKFLIVRADDKKSAMCEPSRDYTREIGVREWEEDGNTAHIILVEADRRQIYAAAPRCDTACPAMLDFVVYLLYRTGLAVIAAIPMRLLFAVGQFLGFCAWLVSGNIDAWRNAMLPLRLPMMKRPREKCVGSSAAISKDSALIFCCSVKLTAMPPEKILRRVKVDNIEAMDREFRAGVPVVLVLRSSRNMGIVRATDAEVCRLRAECECLSKTWQSLR
mgnify:CR=1 FL=1